MTLLLQHPDSALIGKVIRVHLGPWCGETTIMKMLLPENESAPGLTRVELAYVSPSNLLARLQTLAGPYCDNPQIAATP